MSKKTKSGSVTRYDEATRAKIGKFLKNHTNAEAKVEFGCTSHFAGALRREQKIKPFKPEKVERKTIKETLGKKKAKKSLL